MCSGQEWLFRTIPYLVQNILLYTKRNWCRMSLCILYRMWRTSSLRQWVASELHRLHHKRNSNWMEGWIPILRLWRGVMREVVRLVPPPWCQLGKENGRYNCQRFPLWSSLPWSAWCWTTNMNSGGAGRWLTRRIKVQHKFKRGSYSLHLFRSNFDFGTTVDRRRF